jgi:hypothetical protein
MVEAENIQLGTRFDEMSDKYLYKYPDRRDGHLIRYLLGYGFMDKRLFPECKLCGSNNNSRKHVTNECVFFNDLRRNTLENIGKIIDVANLDDLEYWVNVIYFGPYLSWNSTKITKLIGTLKKFACSLYLDRPKL